MKFSLFPLDEPSHKQGYGKATTSKDDVYRHGDLVRKRRIVEHGQDGKQHDLNEIRQEGYAARS